MAIARNAILTCSLIRQELFNWQHLQSAAALPSSLKRLGEQSPEQLGRSLTCKVYVAVVTRYLVLFEVQ